MWRCSDEMNVLTWDRSRPYTDKSFVHLEQRYTESITILPENIWHFLIHFTLSKNKTFYSFNITSIEKHLYNTFTKTNKKYKEMHQIGENTNRGNNINT